VSKLVRVRADCVLEVLDHAGNPYLEVHPGYEDRLGPCIHIKRVIIHGDVVHVATLRLASVSELVRKLPIPIAAARRLQNGTDKPAR